VIIQKAVKQNVCIGNDVASKKYVFDDQKPMPNLKLITGTYWVPP